MKLPDKRIGYAKIEHSAEGLLWIAPLKGENLRQLKRRVVNSIYGHGIRPLKFLGYVLKSDL